MMANTALSKVSIKLCSYVYALELTECCNATQSSLLK